jgi:hypothetical protein
MSSYIPSFSRNPKGKYNPKANFVSVKGGTDAYLLEDELNELQWIQSDATATLIRTIATSGCITKSSNANTSEDGAIIAHNFLVKDTEGKTISEADTIKSEAELNCFSMMPFDVVLNGYIAHIESTSPDGLKVQLDGPSTIGSYRKDLIILEFWFKELSLYDKVPAYGGVDNDALSYNIVDSRIGCQTTNKIQLQWRIRTITGDYDEDAPHYNDGTTDISKLAVHPRGPKDKPFAKYTFSTAPTDSHMFVAGADGLTNSIFGTVDGKIYAIPLFEVHRLNQSGYTIKNSEGALCWKNKDSVSDRITLDGKFANVIYTNDILDDRHLSAIGERGFNDIYLRQDKFNEYNNKVIKQMDANVQQNTENITKLSDREDADISELQKQVDMLTMLTM